MVEFVATRQPRLGGERRASRGWEGCGISTSSITGARDTQGVGEVELATDGHGALEAHLVGVDVEEPVLGGEEAAVLGLDGVEQRAGCFDGAFELGPGEAVGNGCQFSGFT